MSLGYGFHNPCVICEAANDTVRNAECDVVDKDKKQDESNNLLCNQQHGFRSGHSCLTQLLHHFDDILENFLDGNDTDCIYLDYAKAFDKVDHALLIKKLSKYGIHPKIIKWIDSFLNDRTQQVVVDGQLSVAALIVSSVPQGTVLGPILFFIFINDITFCVTNSVICCFAA